MNKLKNLIIYITLFALLTPNMMANAFAGGTSFNPVESIPLLVHVLAMAILLSLIAAAIVGITISVKKHTRKKRK